MNSNKFPFISARRLIPLFAVLLLGLLASIAATAQSTNQTSATIENFGKVNEHYYRGSQPFAENFAKLKRFGVKTVIDLRQDKESQAKNWARERELQYFNIPLTTKRPATEEQIKYFLKLVDDPVNWPVYVHCKGGRHRTGEMTAIYRITHNGWTANEAYEEMKKYDFEDGFFYPRSLKRFVFSFYERFTTTTSSLNQAPGH